MSSSRPSMTTKPVQGYQIIDDGLVWYPIADDSQANNVFMNTYEQQLVITNITGTYTFKTPADYFAALTKRHIHSEQTLYLEMLKVIRQRIAADEFKQALLATQNGYLYCDFYAEGDSVWDGGKDGKGKNLLGRALMEVRNELFIKSDQKNMQVDLNGIFAQADNERSKKTETGVALHTFAKPIIVAPSFNANSSTITVASSVPTGTSTTATSSSSSTSSSADSASSPSSSPSSSSSSSTGSSTGSTSSSVPSSSALLTPAKLEEIKIKLGGAWTHRPGSINDTNPAPFTIFENEAVPTRIRRFEIHENTISTDDTDEDTLLKMLEAFTLLNPGKSPSITVGNTELEGKWKAVCKQQNIIADIKVNKPVAEDKADTRVSSTREEEKEAAASDEFDPNTVHSLPRQRRPHSLTPHGHERASLELEDEHKEEVKEEKEASASLTSSTSSAFFGGGRSKSSSPTSSSTPVVSTSSPVSQRTTTHTPR